MPYDWSEVFIGVGAAPQRGKEPIEAKEERRRGWVKSLKEGLSRSRKTLAQQLAAIFTERIDDELWEKIEEALIAADVGVASTVAITEELERLAAAGEIKGPQDLLKALRRVTAGLFSTKDTRIDVSHAPSVLLVTGVNGTGKTTTIGKIAWHLRQVGKEPLLVAADTFRAAAVEQLVEWGNRVGADVIRQKQGSDPAAVVYDGLSAALARKIDVVIVDTAGRLHTQVNLMRELEKISRVIQKQIPRAPHETLLTIDATTGQNGLVQARLFKEAVGVTGIVLTKMDGTAKGGIAVAVSHELDVPIKLIGVGEKMTDLQPFDAQGFVELLFSDELLASA